MGDKNRRGVDILQRHRCQVAAPGRTGRGCPLRGGLLLVRARAHETELAMSNGLTDLPMKESVRAQAR